MNGRPFVRRHPRLLAAASARATLPAPTPVPAECQATPRAHRATHCVGAAGGGGQLRRMRTPSLDKVRHDAFQMRPSSLAGLNSALFDVAPVREMWPDERPLVGTISMSPRPARTRKTCLLKLEKKVFKPNHGNHNK